MFINIMFHLKVSTTIDWMTEANFNCKLFSLLSLIKEIVFNSFYKEWVLCLYFYIYLTCLHSSITCLHRLIHYFEVHHLAKKLIDHCRVKTIGGTNSISFSFIREVSLRWIHQNLPKKIVDQLFITEIIKRWTQTTPSFIALWSAVRHHKSIFWQVYGTYAIPISIFSKQGTHHFH